MTNRQHVSILAALAIAGTIALTFGVSSLYELGQAHAERPAIVAHGEHQVAAEESPRALVARADAAPTPAAAAPPATASSASEPKPSDQLHNPVDDPRSSWGDVDAARKKAGWPLAVLVALIVLARGLGTLGDRRTQLKFLSPLGGIVGTVIAGVGGVGAAAFDALALGGSGFVALLAAAGAFLLLVHPDPPKNPPKKPA